VSFQLQGGNPASNDYDYESGSGMDGFLSRSIDEVSWQSTLGTAYNSLSALPIGAYQTTATPTNFDQTQISGSQSGTTTLGGSAGGSAGGSGSLQIDATNNVITLNDGTNDRLILGSGSF
jgi:hypothetical protein